MKKSEKIFSVLICAFLIITCLGSIPAYAEVYPAPELYAQTGVLINGDSGEVLFDKNRTQQKYPASTTKVMTAILTIENLDLNDYLTVSANAASQDGVGIGLKAGEHVRVEDALYAMMLKSANDAAMALGETVGGDVTSFADMMNEKATELGAQSTHFVTPNGLPNDSHVTSAYDLALFAKYAMQNDEFRKVVSTVNYTMAATNMSPERELTNSNKLLSDDTDFVTVYGQERPVKYDGAIGVKTGYTNAAGSCLVAAAERNGTYLIGVVMDSTPEELYTDMIKLFEFGFNSYRNVTVVKAGDVVGQANVERGSSGKVDVTVTKDVVGSVEATEDSTSDDLSSFSYTIRTNEVKAPVQAGKVVGSLILYHDSDEIGTYDLVASRDVGEGLIYSLFSADSGAGRFFTLVMITAGLCLVAYLMFVLHVRKRRKAELAARRARKLARERRFASGEMKDEADNPNVLSVEEIPQSMETVPSAEPDGTEGTAQNVTGHVPGDAGAPADGSPVSAGGAAESKADAAAEDNGYNLSDKEIPVNNQVAAPQMPEKDLKTPEERTVWLREDAEKHRRPHED